MSANSSRSLTPSVQESQNKPKKRGRPKNSKNKIKAAAKEKKEKKRGRPRIHDKPKFKMVLEEDDDYEVDYLSPEEDDDLISNYSEDQKDEVASLSDDNTSIADDISLGGISSIRPYFEEEFDDDDDENIPELVLPPSSDDLLISNELLLPALQVYEVLRHFRTVLRLSPMLFEDFCAALISSETSIIMSECHMVLLKALLKEDDQNNVLFVPPDQKETSNSYFYFVDHITWPEVLKYYIQSCKDYSEVESILEHPNFPLVEVEQRITVLQLLTDLFIASTKIRDQLMMDGTIQYDDHCRACHKLGDLLCCETCSAVYHLACTTPPMKEVPEEEWHCELCVNHKLNGLTNCETDEEWFGQYLRHDIIGTDRHSRKYWFLARRIIVECEDEVIYYSTNEEFQYLLTILDPERYEVVLGEAMKNIMSEFPLQSKITEQITTNVVEDQKHKGGSCLSLIKERTRKMIEEEDRKREELEERQREEEEHRYNMTMEEKILKEEEANNNEDDDPPPLPIDPDKVKTEEDSSSATANQTAEVNGSETSSVACLKTSDSQKVVVKTEPVADGGDLPTVPSMFTMKPPQSNVQKAQLPLPLPAPSVAASSNPSTLQLLKAGQKIHVPTGGSMSTIKNLYVVKDGVKTPIAVSGKIISSPKIVFVNQNKQKCENSEIRKVQFTGSGQSVPMLISPVPSMLGSQALQDNNRPMEVGNLDDSLDQDPFRLGEDEGYKHYINQYTEHPLAQNKYQLKENKDRDRHIGNRFSLTGSGAFNWDDPVHGDKERIVNTLRSMLFRFEEQVPLCFMHSKWEQYRKMWARMLIKNNSQKAMSIVLGILEQAIRDSVKKPTWKEYMGCVTMRRLVTSEKEEFDKKKKLKSKQQEDRIQKSATWCKYPLVTISSNLCKLKGEDYRVSGFGGWYWHSGTAQFTGKKYVPKVAKEVEKQPDIKQEVEKPKSPTKEIVTMKSDADVTADVIAAASAADDQQEEEKSTAMASEEEKNKEATIIDVAASLLNRSNGIYSKTWAPSRVDKLLKLRQAQEASIKAEKEKAAEEKDSKKKEGEKVDDKKEEKKEESVPPPRIAFTPSGKGSYSKSARNDTKYDLFISRRFRKRIRKRSQITEGLDDSCKVWKFKKSKETLKIKTVQMPLPWKFSARKGRKKSIFRLPLIELRPLICRGGCTWTPRCFHQSWKNPNYLDLYWPYPAPRPTISTSWRYKIQSATSYASIAYSLRILWHSIRWEDMAMKPTNADAVHAVHNDDSIVTTELMKRRDVGLSGLRQEYYIRRIVMPVGEQDTEIQRSETYTPSSRSGLRTRNRPIALRDRNHRKSEQPTNKPKVENLWLPEQHIELWQIRQFDLALREERKKQKKKYTAVQGPPVNQVIDAKMFKTFHSNSAVQTKQLKISQPLLQQANALSKQQFDSLTFTPPGDSIKISTAGMQLQNSVIKVSEGIVTTNNKQPILQKITIKAPIQHHYVRTASGNVIQTTPLLQSRGSQIILANGNRVLPKPIIIKQGPGGVITANARSLHPTVKLPGPSYKGQAIQVQQNPNNQQKSTGQQFPMATIPTRPIAKLQQQYQQKQMQQKQQQTTTNMQVKLSSSQLNQLMKADNDAVVKVSLKFSNGDPGTGQMQVIPPNKPVFPAPGQQLMQCKVGNEVRKFLLTAGPPLSEQPTLTHVPTTITTIPAQFPVLAATSVMPPPVSPANNEVSVTAPSLRDRLEQLQQRTPDLLKQPFTDGLRLMSDKDPLWSGSALAARSTLPTDTNKLNSGGNNSGGGSFSSGRKQNRDSRGGSGHHHLNHHAHSSDHSKSSSHRGSSVRKRPMVSRDQREEMQRKNSVQQLMKSLLDKVERTEEMEVKRKRKEKLAEQQRRKRESIDEARSHQRLQSRLTLALKRHEEMVKQEIRKRQIITEKYMTKIVENQLFDDTVVQRRNKASAAAAAAEMRSRREKRKLQDAATTSFTSSAPSSSSSRPAKRPRAGMVHTSAKQPTTTSHHRSSVVEKRPADHHHHHHRAGTSSSSSSSTSRKHNRTTPSGATKRTFHRPATPPPIEHRRSPSPPPVVPKKKKMISTSEQLYCVCLTPYDESKFYIGCDLCTNWFHADCVGITKRMAKVMDTWVCPDCKKVKPQEELYCLCKTPYDDSKFYIGCDACQDWFHGTCVGLAEDQASAIESYTCPRCRQEQKDASNEELLNSRDYLNLGKIMRHLKNHKMSWPFLQPVRESDAPGYYKVVKRPMDLSTVMKRLECKHYRKLSALVGDVSLIFDNCRQYNGAASSMVRCAEIVETEFVGKIRDLRGRH